MRAAVIDGPNMPNLGHRDEAIYGRIRPAAALQELVRASPDALGIAAAPPGAPAQSRFTHTATGLVMGMRQYSYLGALLALALALDDATFLGPSAPARQ